VWRTRIFIQILVKLTLNFRRLSAFRSAIFTCAIWIDGLPKSLARSSVTAPSPTSDSICHSVSSLDACLHTPSCQSGQIVAALLVICDFDLSLACPSAAASSLPSNSDCCRPCSAAACLHALSCCIFVCLTCNGASARLAAARAACLRGCTDWILCLQAEHMLFLRHILRYRIGTKEIGTDQEKSLPQNP